MTFLNDVKDVFRAVIDAAKNEWADDTHDIKTDRAVYNSNEHSMKFLRARETSVGSGKYKLAEVTVTIGSMMPVLSVDFLNTAAAPATHSMSVKPVHPDKVFSREEATLYVNDPKNMPGYQAPKTLEAV